MSHYKTLNSAPSFSQEQLRAEYHALMREHHPDRGGDPAKAAAINEAWAALSDQKARQKYHKLLDLTMKKCGVCKGGGGRVMFKRYVAVGFEACKTCGGEGYLPKANSKPPAPTIELSGAVKARRKK